MPPRVFTIGHSNHAIELFLALLTQHRIDVVVDVRSAPYSRYVPHFNKPNLEAALAGTPAKYLYLGRELGGRPEGEEFYDAEGHARYGMVAKTPLFLQGIERVERGIERYRVALMCAEEDPATCHRSLLVGRVLRERGVTVLHLRSDGRVEEDTGPEPSSDNQGLLFPDAAPADTWRSYGPILRRNP